MTTTNRGYATPTPGTEVDTWGTVLNDNFGLIDNNLGGIVSIGLTNINVTLSASQYKCGTIRFTGTLTGNVVITFPAVAAWWTVQNITTGNFLVTLTTGGGGSESIAVPTGSASDIFIDGASVGFRNLPAVGAYVDFAGTALPTWVSGCTIPPFLLCDGTTFSAVTYPRLNALLGGNTLPDFRGRSRFYLDGGTSRITTAGSGIDGATRLAAGGAQNVTLDTTMIPSHSHNNTLTDPGHTHTYVRDDFAANGAGVSSLQTRSGTTTVDTSSSTTGITITNANTGGGLAHNNMPPACIGGITMIRAA